MKILLFGKDGQVGSKLRQALLPLGDVLSMGRKDLPLENLSELADFVKLHKPDIIVNAAAHTAVDKAENEWNLALRVNAHAVEVLASYAQLSGALLVQYSTNYVFDGEKNSSYIETEATNPLNTYGYSKRRGELNILRTNCNHLIFRTACIFDLNGKNFINNILQQAKTKKSLNVVSDQFCTPTSAQFIATMTALAITHYYKDNLAPGIYHLTSTGQTSYYHLAHYIIERALAHDIHLALDTKCIHATPTKDFSLPANRPKHAILNTNALATALKYQIPSWNVFIDQFLISFYELT